MRLQQVTSYTTTVKRPNKFDKLLEWLDKDRDVAGQKYESIHLRLTKIFYARGCYLAEELADETIDRVTNKIDFLSHSYVGNPTLYFYGVAKKVFLEFTRKPSAKELPIHMAQKENTKDLLEEYDWHLTKSLRKLSPEETEFILEYYREDKEEKIKYRKQMARRLGITQQALRVRAFRIRKRLQVHFFDCLANQDAGF